LDKSDYIAKINAIWKTIPNSAKLTQLKPKITLQASKEKFNATFKNYTKATCWQNHYTKQFYPQDSKDPECTAYPSLTKKMYLFASVWHNMNWQNIWPPANCFGHIFV